MKSSNKQESNKEIIASYSMKIVIIATLILAINERQWIWVIGSFVGIFISLIPALLKKDISFTLPWSIELLIASVFGMNMIGILLNAYYTIPGFVLITQLLFSVLVAFFAFAIIYILHVYWDGLIMDKYAMAFLVVVTTMASAVVLEFIKCIGIGIPQDALALSFQHAFDNLPQSLVPGCRNQIRPQLIDGVAQPHGRNIAGQHEYGAVFMTADRRFQRIFVTAFKHVYNLRAMPHRLFNQGDNLGLTKGFGHAHSPLLTSIILLPTPIRCHG